MFDYLRTDDAMLDALCIVAMSRSIVFCIVCIDNTLAIQNSTPMISGAAIAVGYRLRREVDPSESRLNRDACPKPTSVLPPTSLSHAAGGGTSGTSGVSSMLRFGRQREPGAINANGTPASVQPIAFASSLTARRYFRISSARASGSLRDLRHRTL